MNKFKLFNEDWLMVMSRHYDKRGMRDIMENVNTIRLCAAGLIALAVAVGLIIISTSI